MTSLVVYQLVKLLGFKTQHGQNELRDATMECDPNSSFGIGYRPSVLSNASFCSFNKNIIDQKY